MSSFGIPGLQAGEDVNIPECCEFPEDLCRMLAETGGGTCDVTDCDLCWHGRSMEVLSEYVSSCDGCGEPVHHDLQVMDEETQLGYCKECRPDLFTD